MFEDKEQNRKMVIGAYKKLKSYFYYDKTILYNKMRLATWESDEIEMNKRIEDLADFLSTLEMDCDYEYVKLLISGVGFVPMPKAFKEKPIENNLLQNKISDNNEIDKVNFFIRAPIELMIIDTIWMLMIGKIASEQNSISSAAYANKIKKQIFFQAMISLMELTLTQIDSLYRILSSTLFGVIMLSIKLRHIMMLDKIVFYYH